MSTRKRWRNIKVKIESIIENIDTNEKNVYNLLGRKENNKIEYNDDSFINTILIDEIISMKRENNEVSYTLNFDKNNPTKSNYTLKEYNLSIDIIIVTNNIEISDSSIKIEYIQKIDNDEFNYCYYLKWEETKWTRD